MLKVYKSFDNTLIEKDQADIAESNWFYLLKPNSDEMKIVSDITNIPIDFLQAALDKNEHSRIEIEDNCILVIINVPLMIDKNSFDTLPVGIIITENHIVTVALKETKILESFIGNYPKNFSSFKNITFLFLILLRSAELYLRYMRYINHLTDELEYNLRKSMKNKSLFQLFELERSLVYFTTALKDNKIVTEKILRLSKNTSFHNILKFDEDDEELLEDVMIENKQAIEMVEMHSNILSGMMDAFASIISNNLNMVMKFLTTVTILLAIPTMIASFWGMNVDVPMKNHPGGFVLVIALSIVATATTSFILWRKRMF